ISVVLANASNDDVLLRIGDRVAQLVVIRIDKPVPTKVQELQATARGMGGFGSTNQDVNVAAISTWQTAVGSPKDSYAGDKYLEKVKKMITGEIPVGPSAKNSLKKYSVRQGL
ncbi:hypothetical protein LPJ59_005110, partial [Coemansia sp. RSA 2399]